MSRRIGLSGRSDPAARRQSYVELATLRQDDPELLVGEVDRHSLERANGIHAEEKRRLFVETELLECVNVTEDDREIGEADPADRHLTHHHIVAEDLLPGHGFKHD